MSLLAKVSAQVAQSQRPKNMVIRVKGFKLDPNGTLTDQRLIGTTLDGREVTVVMNPPISDKAAQMRTTIVDLKTKPKKMVQPGAFVRIDKAILKGDTYHCDFVRRLTITPNDPMNHFVQLQARVNRATTSTKTAFGQEISVTRGRIDLMAPHAATIVDSAESFKAAVQNFLIDNPPPFATLGRRGVLIRDPNTPEVSPRMIYINATKTNDGYATATPAEVMAQLQQNVLYMSLEQALTANPGYVLEVVPAAAVMALDQTAGEREYANNANIFFRGKFNSIGAGGEVTVVEAAGFREAIIGLSCKEPGSPWYVVSVAHTGEGELTLNGLESSKAIRNELVQQEASAPTPTGEAPQAAQPAVTKPAVAQAQAQRPAQSSAPAPQHFTDHEYADYPEASTEFDEGPSLESLLDDSTDIDDEISRAVSAFNQQSM